MFVCAYGGGRLHFIARVPGPDVPVRVPTCGRLLLPSAGRKGVKLVHEYIRWQVRHPRTCALTHVCPRLPRLFRCRQPSRRCGRDRQATRLRIQHRQQPWPPPASPLPPSATSPPSSTCCASVQETERGVCRRTLCKSLMASVQLAKFLYHEESDVRIAATALCCAMPCRRAVAAVRRPCCVGGQRDTSSCCTCSRLCSCPSRWRHGA